MSVPDLTTRFSGRCTFSFKSTVMSAFAGIVEICIVQNHHRARCDMICERIMASTVYQIGRKYQMCLRDGAILTTVEVYAMYA